MLIVAFLLGVAVGAALMVALFFLGMLTSIGEAVVAARGTDEERASRARTRAETDAAMAQLRRDLGDDYGASLLNREGSAPKA